MWRAQKGEGGTRRVDEEEEEEEVRVGESRHRSWRVRRGEIGDGGGRGLLSKKERGVERREDRGAAVLEVVRGKTESGTHPTHVHVSRTCIT